VYASLKRGRWRRSSAWSVAIIGSIRGSPKINLESVASECRFYIFARKSYQRAGSARMEAGYGSSAYDAVCCVLFQIETISGEPHPQADCHVWMWDCMPEYAEPLNSVLRSAEESSVSVSRGRPRLSSGRRPRSKRLFERGAVLANLHLVPIEIGGRSPKN
jgi:hypothetical protein